MTRVAFIAAALMAVAAVAAAAPLPVTLDPAVPRGPGAATRGPGAATRGPIAAHGIRREAFTLTAPASFGAILTPVPADARLLTAIAVPAAVPAEPTAPVRFRVAFESDGTSTTLYDRVLDGSDARDQRWIDVGIALAPLAGRSGTLRFDVTAARPDAAGVPTGWWAPPELAVCPDTAPSLLLITIDALRADRLGSAGYARATTPRLDAFAKDATRFTAAFAGGPKTIPSIPQLLTGRYFYWHRQGRGLAGLLGDGDTPSRAIVNNPYVATWLRGEQPGFDAVHAGELDARAITSAALRYLNAAGPCATTLYLHYLDTHTPYHAPARYARRFIDRHAAATIGLAFDDVTRAWQNGYGDIDKQRIADLYDGSVAFTDHQIGRLFRGLARRGRLDRTLVIVTADHGEELWDHHHFFHGQSLYDELLHVPLLVRFPNVGHGRVVDPLVRTIDILPTIAEAMGHPAEVGDGRSLQPLAAGDANASAGERIAFALVSHAEPRTPERQAVRTKTAKLIHNVGDGAIEVYDLTTDPKERRNLGPAAPAATELRQALAGFRAQFDGKGYQLRLRGRPDRPVRYVLDLTSYPPLPVVAIDRLSLEADDRIDFKPRTSAFSIIGTLTPGDEDHVRFDVLAAVGTLKLVLRVDGEVARDDTLHLGAQAIPTGPVVDLTDPELDSAPTGPRASDGVSVELWRASTAANRAPAPALDDATRERLRQLGYVE